MIPPDPALPPDPDDEPRIAEPLVPVRPADPEDGHDAPVPPPSSGPPGGSTFTIEGRQAPALFVVGWLATIMGLAMVLIALLGGGTPTAIALLFVGAVVLTIGLIAGAGSQGIERRARGQSAYAGPSPFLVFAATIPIAVLVAAVIGIPLSALGIPLTSPIAAVLSLAATVLIYIGLIRLLVVDTGALSWAEMGVRRPDGTTLRELLAGAAWAVPVIVATIPIAAIVTLLFPVEVESPLPPAGSAAGLLLNLLAGAILAPIGEELFFRGFATTAWARDLGPRPAIVRGALFFAIVHILNITAPTADQALGLVIVQFVSRLPVAFTLGWLFLRRGNLWAPIGLHATFNGILLILGELALQVPTDAPTT